MAPLAESQPVTALRVVTQRLSNTPTSSLPHVAPILAGFITDSRDDFLFLQNEGNAKSGSDAATLFHQLKTQLSALLQDKAPQARFAAVVLIKTFIEVGGLTVLQTVGTWVRGMIGVIGRPDSSATKKLCVISLARIFLLTQGHQTLTREITTPSLSPFITTALKAAAPSTSAPGDRAPSDRSPLLSVVLEAFCELVILHPTSFRPFANQIQSLLFKLVAPTPSSTHSEADCNLPCDLVVQSARKLLTLLPVCAPKNTAAEEWQRSLQAVILSTQRTADRVFRGFVEDRRTRTDSTNMSDLLSDEVVGDLVPQPLTLPGWVGIHAGVERLDGLLNTIQAFLCSTTSVAVTLPVSNTVNLTERVLSVLQSHRPRGPRARPEIGRDEHEGLELGLPRLHVSSIAILSILLSRMRKGYAAMLQATMERIFAVLDAEYKVEKIRLASYTLVSQLLAEFGPTLPYTYRDLVSQCIKHCCEDLLPTKVSTAPDPISLAAKGKIQGNGKQSVDYIVSSKGTSTAITQTSLISDEIKNAAEKLLSSTLTNLPSGFLPTDTRNRIDQTSILINNKEMMLASVMNPPTRSGEQHSDISILPLLARASGGSLGCEALLRPQMPMMAEQGVEDELNTFENKLVERVNNNSRFFFSDTSNSASDFSRRVNLEQPFENSSDNKADAPGLADAIADQSGIGLEDGGLSLADANPHASSSSQVTNKRTRRLSHSTSMRSDSGSSAISAATARKEASSKRPRLEVSGERQQKDAFDDDDDDNKASEQLTKAIKAFKTPLTNEMKGIEQPDSDESDFEMPPLHLESDSDEEVDDEDEDED